MAREGALILLFAYRSPPRISEEANPVDTFLNFPRFKVRAVFLVLFFGKKNRFGQQQKQRTWACPYVSLCSSCVRLVTGTSS